MPNRNEGAEVDEAVFERLHEMSGVARAFEITRGKSGLPAFLGGTLFLGVIISVIAFQRAG